MSYPDMVQLRSQPQLSGAVTSGSYRVVSKGRVQTESLQSLLEDHSNVVAAIKDGVSVGRACCVVGPNSSAVAETGWHFDHEELASRLPLGKYHPYYRRYVSQGDLRSRKRLPKECYLRGTVAAINNRAAHNYYHWLIDVAPRLAVLDLHGIDADYVLIDCQSRFQKRLLELLGITSERIVQPHCQLNVRCDELLCVPEHNLAAVSHVARLLRRRLPHDSMASRRIFVTRRKARNRRLVQETQIARLLVARGFEVVCFEDLKSEEQIRTVAEASTIVTSHGAALANTIFAQPGTNIVEIFPQQRSNLKLYPSLSVGLGLRHISVLADYTPLRKNLVVPLSDVELAVDEALSLERHMSVAQVA